MSANAGESRKRAIGLQKTKTDGAMEADLKRSDSTERLASQPTPNLADLPRTRSKLSTYIKKELDVPDPENINSQAYIQGDAYSSRAVLNRTRSKDMDMKAGGNFHRANAKGYVRPFDPLMDFPAPDKGLDQQIGIKSRSGRSDGDYLNVNNELNGPGGNGGGCSSGSDVELVNAALNNLAPGLDGSSINRRANIPGQHSGNTAGGASSSEAFKKRISQGLEIKLTSNKDQNGPNSSNTPGNLNNSNSSTSIMNKSGSAASGSGGGVPGIQTMSSQSNLIAAPNSPTAAEKEKKAEEAAIAEMNKNNPLAKVVGQLKNGQDKYFFKNKLSDYQEGEIEAEFLRRVVANDESWVVQCLTQFGTKVIFSDWAGGLARTAILYSSKSGKEEMCKVLLAYGGTELLAVKDMKNRDAQYFADQHDMDLKNLLRKGLKIDCWNFQVLNQMEKAQSQLKMVEESTGSKSSGGDNLGMMNSSAVKGTKSTPANKGLDSDDNSNGDDVIKSNSSPVNINT